MDNPLTPRELFEPDDLVVGINDVEHVKALLEEFRADVSIRHRDSPRLGLSLVRLSKVDLLRQELEEDRELVDSVKKYREGTLLENEPVPTLDLLIAHLRNRSAKMTEFVIAKNRSVGGLEGAPHFGGGDGDPEPIPGKEPLSFPSEVGEGIAIGLADTRLLDLPAFKGRYQADADSVLRPWQPELSTNGHAAFLLGIILRMAPTADVNVRWVLNDEAAASDSWEVAERLLDLRDAGVKVINFSAGCKTADAKPPLVLTRLVERLGDVLLVAAAGNTGPTVDPALAKLPVWPAALAPDYRMVIAVGASISDEEIADFSPRETWVTLLAPGTDIVSAYLTGPVTIVRRTAHGETVFGPTVDFGQAGKARWEGTSFSAAHVTGAIAAILAATPMTPADFAELLDKRDPGLEGLLKTKQIRCA